MESLTNSVLLFFEFNFTMLRKKGLPEEKNRFKAFETRKKAPNKFSFSKCYKDTKKIANPKRSFDILLSIMI